MQRLTHEHGNCLVRQGLACNRDREAARLLNCIAD
jgi:hypothetical protein